MKNEEILPNGSRMEVEIRGCSIFAVDRIVKKINAQGLKDIPRVNAILLDYFLWGYRRELAKEMEKFPYRKVRSIYY